MEVFNILNCSNIYNIYVDQYIGIWFVYVKVILMNFISRKKIYIYMNENFDKFIVLIKYLFIYGLFENLMKINIRVLGYIEIYYVIRCIVSDDNNQVLINFLQYVNI